MEPLLYVMAILGCGEDESTCRELRLAEARFATETACLAATEAELSRHDGASWPIVVAQCRPAGAAARPLSGSDVALPDPPRHRTPPRLAAAPDRGQRR
jgi:hypothetical protein